MTSREIKEFRLKLKLNFTEFGKLIGVTAESVSNWEKGKFKCSSFFVRKIKLLMDSNAITD